MSKILEGVAVLGALVLYLMPAIIADMRGRPDAFAVTLVNVLLGWTVVGWLGAFVWARQPISDRRLFHAAMSTRRAIARMTIAEIVARARHRGRFSGAPQRRLATISMRAEVNRKRTEVHGR
jgi:hypothetical protein